MDCSFSCEELKEYRVNQPYPKVNITSQNLCYAKIISGGYAGKGSETTAVAQYSVHRYYLREYADVFNAYKYIAYVEMIHWELLGNLVKDLGLSPQLVSCETRSYWNGGYPANETAFGKIIESDIAGEHHAIAHYNQMICAIDNHEIQELFQRIILDEQKHIEVLTRLYSKYR